MTPRCYTVSPSLHRACAHPATRFSSRPTLWVCAPAPPPLAEPDAAVAHAPFRLSLSPRTTRPIPAAGSSPSPRRAPAARRLPWHRGHARGPGALIGWGSPAGGPGTHTLSAQPMGLRASLPGLPTSRPPLNKPHCCTKLQRRSPGPPPCHPACQVRGPEHHAVEPQKCERPRGARVRPFPNRAPVAVWQQLAPGP